MGGKSNDCGLLWLIEELIGDEQHSSSSSSSRVETFMRRLLDSDPQRHYISTPAQSPPTSALFSIHHQYDQFSVTYDLTEWLVHYNKEFHAQRNALALLQSSRHEHVCAAFTRSAHMSSAAANLTSSSTTSTNLAATNTNDICTYNEHSSSSSSSSSQLLKRQASVRKMLTLSKRKTFAVNFKLQIDSLFDSIRRTQANFLVCFVAHLGAAAASSTPSQTDMDVDVAVLRAQLRAHQILAACRIYRQGFPDAIGYEHFARRFANTTTTTSNSHSFIPRVKSSHGYDIKVAATTITAEMRDHCVALLSAAPLELDASQYKCGSTQLFFKAGTLATLAQRVDKWRQLDTLVVKVQALARRHLAAQRFAKRKV